MAGYFFIQFSNIKFHENPSSCSQVVSFTQADERSDEENSDTDTSRIVIQIAHRQDSSGTDRWEYTALSFPHFSVQI
jgi:hypothetical protein